ncbi:MAG: bacillithiol system redox-active protein YtxJ [Bacteroidetes bacterium]|nr:MAG: bacillithiol system redox-active protein YtxJ [Bacteroidota bacterium]TAF93645.1 MAG: bacillithiol system redox-active protein YtxJ [Bacteroidota bacterium]
MDWIALTTEEQLETIRQRSATKTQVIFKHSTRCSVSSMALNRLNTANLPQADYYLLDLIAFRNISNLIADQFHVYHESPQVLVIKNGECIFDESHLGITAFALEEVV